MLDAWNARMPGMPEGMLELMMENARRRKLGKPEKSTQKNCWPTEKSIGPRLIAGLPTTLQHFLVGECWNGKQQKKNYLFLCNL